MLRSGFAIDETSAPAITPDQLGEMKKRDMKQAIVERFSYRAKAVLRRPRSSQRNAPRTGSRWTRSADRALDVRENKESRPRPGQIERTLRFKGLLNVVMKSTFQQFRDPTEQIATFERLFRAALESFLPDLADAPWCVREREVVNLFVFRHLVPKFQAEKLDIGQIGIEIPVQKVRENDKAKSRKYGDIVVWPHNKATIWLTCKPLVHIEWKNISCQEKHPGALKKEHEKDIRYLTRDRQYACVSYAVLTEWHPFPRERRMGERDRHVDVHCKRISDATDPEDSFVLRHQAICPESAFAALQGDDSGARSREHACPDCKLAEHSRAATAE